MDTLTRFLYEFLSQFFNGIWSIIKGIIDGFATMFNIKEYIRIITEYKNDFNISEWILVGVAIAIIMIILILIILCIYFALRKYIRIRKSLVEQESLLTEVGDLNEKVVIICGLGITGGVYRWRNTIGCIWPARRTAPRWCSTNES